MARSSLIRLAVPTVALALAVSACGGGASGSDEGGGTKDLKVAALFSGSATDAGYNSLGLLEGDEAKGVVVRVGR